MLFLEEDLLIVLALALVLAFSLFLTAVIRPPARVGALLSVYLLSFTNIVLVGEITNTFYQLNNRWLWLALHLLLAMAAGLAWWRAGRPSLRALFAGPDGRVFSGMRESLKCWPDIWVLGTGVVLSFLFSAVLLWVAYPNNNDSLATHMSRIGFWLQQGSFFPWPTDRVWQITYPVNMQLQMFWTILFLGTDKIVEIVQWVGALAATAAAYGIGRLLGAARPQAMFAALLLATFPEIILESTTTQNDLVAGTLFAAMLYLLFLGLRGGTQPSNSPPHLGSLALSGLALALGLGTKQTLFFLLPGLAVVLALVWWYGGRRAFHSLIAWGLAGLAAFILIGVYMFVVNQVNFSHPMGPETAVSAQTGGQDSQSLRDNLLYSPFRLLYQSIDLTGLPDPLCGYGIKAKALVVKMVTDALHFPVEAPVAVAKGHQFDLSTRYVVQEDAGWYGPLFALLVLPALVYQLVKGIRVKDALRIGIFILALTFLIVNSVLRPGWDPFQGRYFIPVVMIATPLVAFSVRPGRWMTLARWAVVALALTIVVNTYLQNSGKPISGEYNVFTADRVVQETQQSFYMREPVRMVERKVPADATLGLVMYSGYQEYPFFREDFSRRVINVYPPSQVLDTAWLKRQGIEYLLLLAPDGEVVQMPDGLQPVAQAAGWTIFTWAPGR